MRDDAVLRHALPLGRGLGRVSIELTLLFYNGMHVYCHCDFKKEFYMSAL